MPADHHGWCANIARQSHSSSHHQHALKLWPAQAHLGPDQAQLPCATTGSRTLTTRSSLPHALHTAATRPPCASARRHTVNDYRRRPGRWPS
jgi:hypothetical protein